jgi:hypothetical protein
MEATVFEVGVTPASAVRVVGDRTRFAVAVDGAFVIVIMTKKGNGVSFEADTPNVAAAAAAIAAATKEVS